MNEHGLQAAGSLEFREDAIVTRSVVGLVRARDVQLTDAGAGFVSAGGNVSILNGGCGPVLANGPLTIRNGRCGPVLANGDVSIQNGGTQTIVAAGGATIGRKAFVGIVVSPSVTVEDGAKVLMSSEQALAFGAAVGAAFVLLSRLIRSPYARSR